MNYSTLVAVVLTLAAVAAHSKEMPCPTEHAIRAEKQLDHLQSWGDAAAYYQSNKACDDGGVSERYTTFLASKFARPDGVTSLWRETEKQRWFRSVVAKRMQSEVISLDTTESILENLKSQCPQAAKAFCRDLRVKIKKSCQACDPKK